MTRTANLIFLASGLLVTLAMACHPKPPPPPPEPAPAEAPPPPPPPPPPKCEAMSEACTGQAGTVARIRKSGFGIAIPQGWTYAQQDDATLVTTDSAEFAVTTYDIGGDTKTTNANRDAAFDALVKLLAVTPPKHKVAWGHAAKKSKVGALDMSLWQADDVTRTDKKGSVLVFGAPLPDKSLLLGVGFVSNDDKTDADKAILAAIDSIAPAPAAPAESPAPAPPASASSAPSASPAAPPPPSPSATP